MRTLKIWYEKSDSTFMVSENGASTKHKMLEFERPLKVSFVNEHTGGGFAYVELAI